MVTIETLSACPHATFPVESVYLYRLVGISALHVVCIVIICTLVRVAMHDQQLLGMCIPFLPQSGFQHSHCTSTHTATAHSCIPSVPLASSGLPHNAEHLSSIVTQKSSAVSEGVIRVGVGEGELCVGKPSYGVCMQEWTSGWGNSWVYVNTVSLVLP